MGRLDFSFEAADGVCGFYVYLKRGLLAVRCDEQKGKYLEDFLLGGFDGDLHDGLQPRRDASCYQINGINNK